MSSLAERLLAYQDDSHVVVIQQHVVVSEETSLY
jgi:hypothetical protein